MQTQEIKPQLKPVCYINYLDSKNGFKQTKKEFTSHDAAFKWMCKNFDSPNVDLIKYY